LTYVPEPPILTYYAEVSIVIVAMKNYLIAVIFIVIFLVVAFAVVSDSISGRYLLIGIIIGILALSISVALYRRFTRIMGRRRGR
jgi:heme/copper-type cytochrome/quinol oxidase subunit 4